MSGFGFMAPRFTNAKAEAEELGQIGAWPSGVWRQPTLYLLKALVSRCSDDNKATAVRGNDVSLPGGRPGRPCQVFRVLARIRNPTEIAVSPPTTTTVKNYVRPQR